MRVTATQRDESVVCELPEGDKIEIIMVCAEGDRSSVEPNLDSVPRILERVLEAQLEKSEKVGVTR